MFYTNLDWIHVNQLITLGLTEKQFYFILFFIVIFVSYYVLQPIIHWFVTLQSTKILSYLITSLLVLLCMFAFGIHQLVKMALQSLAVFGGILFLLRVFHGFFKKGKKNSA
ncbi:hypothetical protein [Lentibacillus sp. Marseille-P4043]|uniref:hypothetical protein n=1 Tax=Lentibacillus sp. Marseille-P4043 TaxID=2040293 RepID=UPI000D0AF1F9|nr:hypothetical protein [Lentibacillus sp. Marseille-P4043]